MRKEGKSKVSSRRKFETGIAGHKQIKKRLIPPLLQMPTLKFSVWHEERLPEMLWAVLVVGKVTRSDALEFFRHAVSFIGDHKDCHDVQLTGIANWSQSERTMFLDHLAKFKSDCLAAMRPLTLFPNLPAFADWRSLLGDPVLDVDWPQLAISVDRVFWRQSQEATDCRWLKVISKLVAGKMIFPETMKDHVREISGYPDYGDQARVRPFIRATEIGPDHPESPRSSRWAHYFWQICKSETPCMPEQRIDESRHDSLSKEFELMNDRRQYIYDQIGQLRQKIIQHYLNRINTTGIDGRLDASFGCALLALALADEIVFFGFSMSASSRIILRSMAENAIQFKYMLGKESIIANIWDVFRGYGRGQLKLAYLKWLESGDPPHFVDMEQIRQLVEEDHWLEVQEIDLGQWHQSDLRSMSEEAGIKPLYDKYYGFLSGYSHAHWFAQRESVFQPCLNPLHRYHKLPSFEMPQMPDISVDLIQLLNFTLEMLSTAYPEFNDRVVTAS